MLDIDVGENQNECLHSSLQVHIHARFEESLINVGRCGIIIDTKCDGLFLVLIDEVVKTNVYSFGVRLVVNQDCVDQTWSQQCGERWVGVGDWMLLTW